MRDTDLAYLAGVIDSDGYISATSRIRNGRLYVGAQVGIAGTRREPHDLAASVFGGNVRAYEPRDERAHHRRQFQWQRYGRNAVPVIEAVLPYLRIKIQQAQLALDLEGSLELDRVMRGHNDPYPWFGPDFDPQAALRDAADEIKALNARGRELPEAVTAHA